MNRLPYSWDPPAQTIPTALLRWLRSNGGRDLGKLRALLLDRSREFGRGTGTCNDAERRQPIADCGTFHDCPNISCNAVAKLRWHVLRAKESSHAIEREIAISGFRCGRHIGRKRSARPVEEGQKCCPAGLCVREYLCESSGDDLNTAFAKVRKGWVEIAIRHICHFEAGRFHESGKGKIGNAGGGGPIDPGRARSRIFYQICQRMDL